VTAARFFNPEPTPKAFGAALPIELPTRAGIKFVIQIAGARKVAGQALRLPIVDSASGALALQLQNRQQLAQ
jgi:hypothetical protein